MGGLPVCQQLWMGGDEFPPVVFEGTVVSVERESDAARSSDGRSYPSRKVTFRDIKGWIGEDSTWVTTGMSDADCGYQFEVGRRYVIDANRNPADGTLRTGICSQTRPVEQATELLAYLKTLAEPSSGASHLRPRHPGPGQIRRRGTVRIVPAPAGRGSGTTLRSGGANHSQRR